jgi:molybdopterin-guanine dinucleotide biosynthesis protein A
MDKRTVSVDGVTLLDRTRELIEKLTGHESFVLGDNLAGFSLDQRQVIPDARPGCGPMGGLVAALHHCPAPWCLLLAVDFPWLTTGDLCRLADGRAQEFDVVTLSRSGHPEPLAALYNIRRTDYWQRCLDKGMLSVIDTIRTLAWKPIILGADAISLDGVNTPDDLRRMAVK